MTQEEYWYWLCNIKNMWQGKMDKLLLSFKNPKRIFEAGAQDLEKVYGLKHEDIKNILDSKNELYRLNELEDLCRKEISFLYYGHKDYPEKLKNLYDKPYCLFVKGHLPDPSVPVAAIVGARNCTKYGEQIAQQLGSVLAVHGIQVISGFARGIDSKGQWGAIRSGGKCFGVLGCGIDICYPRENIELFSITSQNGGIISEYPLGEKPLSWRFPHRNRIISGLCDILIVVEARERSGSLITVECALEQGKEIFAIPGRLTDPLSIGCNTLIKEGAHILTNIQDLFENLHYKTKKVDKLERRRNNTLEKDFELVYSCVDLEPKSLQNIIEETGLNSKDVIRILVELEIMELVYEPIINFYSKKI